MGRKTNSSNAINRDFLDERCTLNKVLRIIGKRWVAETLTLIEHDINRYSQLKECMTGISDNVLSNVLNELVREGLIRKNILSEVPVKVEYSITEKGDELTAVMRSLCQWGKKHIPYEIRIQPLHK